MRLFSNALVSYSPWSTRLTQNTHPTEQRAFIPLWDTGRFAMQRGSRFSYRSEKLKLAVIARLSSTCCSLRGADDFPCPCPCQADPRRAPKGSGRNTRHELRCRLTPHPITVSSIICCLPSPVPRALKKITRCCWNKYSTQLSCQGAYFISQRKKCYL